MSLSGALSAAFPPVLAGTLGFVAAALAALWLWDRELRPRAAGTLLVAAAGAALSALGAFLLHLGLDAGETAYLFLRGLAWSLAALAAVHAAGLALFHLLLPRLGLRVSGLSRDLLLAAAYSVALFAVASRAGADVRGLFATSALLTAIIAFSLQDTLGNILGGLVVQLERSFEPGDWVKVGGEEGKVREVRWRRTRLETLSGNSVVVPNSVLVKAPVVVYGRRDGQPYRRRQTVPFHVDYGLAPGHVVETVERALRSDLPPRVAPEPAPHCLLTGFKELHAEYAVRYWLTDLAEDLSTDSEVRLRVHSALAREGAGTAVPGQAVLTLQQDDDRRRRAREEDAARREAALRGVELFRSLTREELGLLAGRLRYAPFSRGEVLTRQGAEAHWLYILVRGEAEVRVRDGAVDQEVATLGPGDFMGEMALLTGEPRRATVTALSEVECYRLDRDAFADIVAKRAEIAESIAQILAQRSVGLDKALGALDERRKAESLRAARTNLLARIRAFLKLA